MARIIRFCLHESIYRVYARVCNICRTVTRVDTSNLVTRCKCARNSNYSRDWDKFLNILIKIAKIVRRGFKCVRKVYIWESLGQFGRQGGIILESRNLCEPIDHEKFDKLVTA